MKIEKDQNLGLPRVIEPVLSHKGTLSSLRLAAHRLADSRKKPKLKTRDLVGLLLCHSARAWRNSMPHVAVKISVSTPNGAAALRFSCPVPLQQG